mgnify:CR=1 FL=1
MLMPFISYVEEPICANPLTDCVQLFKFSMEIDNALYLFYGRKCDRIKAILKEPDGIVMIYKKLTVKGSYRWPRDRSEVRNLTWREFDCLMSGIDIEQPKAIRTR